MTAVSKLAVLIHEVCGYWQSGDGGGFHFGVGVGVGDGGDDLLQTVGECENDDGCDAADAGRIYCGEYDAAVADNNDGLIAGLCSVSPLLITYPAGLRRRI